jgi:hypothetical protein
MLYRLSRACLQPVNCCEEDSGLAPHAAQALANIDLRSLSGRGLAWRSRNWPRAESASATTLRSAPRIFESLALPEADRCQISDLSGQRLNACLVHTHRVGIKYKNPSRLTLISQVWLMPRPNRVEPAAGTSPSVVSGAKTSSAQYQYGTDTAGSFAKCREISLRAGWTGADASRYCGRRYSQ